MIKELQAEKIKLIERLKAIDLLLNFYENDRPAGTTDTAGSATGTEEARETAPKPIAMPNFSITGAGTPRPIIPLKEGTIGGETTKFHKFRNGKPIE